VFKAAYITLIILSFSLFGGTVHSHGPETEEITAGSTGILPDSSLYIIDRFFEKVGDFFAFSEDKKIARLLDHSEERLKEFNILVEKGKLSAARKALFLYEQHVTRAADLTNSVEGSIEILVVQITSRIMNHQEQLSEFVYKGIPDIAQQAILTAIKASEEAYQQSLTNVPEAKRKEIQDMKELYDIEVQRHLTPQREISQPSAPLLPAPNEIE